MSNLFNFFKAFKIIKLKQDYLRFILKYSSTIQPKSLYIGRGVSNFYGTKIEIWKGFGLVDSTEKKRFGKSEKLPFKTV